MASEAGELLMVSGCVVDPLSFLEDRGRFTVEIEPGARASVSLRADADKPRPVVPFGTMVEFPARVRKPRNFGNPGAFDYVRYLARRNTYWLATVQSHAEVQSLGTPCVTAFDAAVIDFVRRRCLVSTDCIQRIRPGSCARCCSGTMIGWTARLRTNFERRERITRL